MVVVIALSWWAAASGAQALVPKLLDADDRKATDEEYLEQMPLNDFFASMLPQENSKRIAAILQRKNDRDLDEMISLTNIGGLFMMNNAQLREALLWIHSVQERKFGDDDPRTGATAVQLAAMFMVIRDYGQTKHFLIEGLPACDERLRRLASPKKSTDPLDDELLIGLSYRGEIALHEGDYVTAEACQRRLLDISRARQNPADESRAESQLGRIMHAKGDKAAARQDYDLAQKILADHGGASLEERGDLRPLSALLCLDEGRREDAAREAQAIWQDNEMLRRNVFNYPENVGLIMLSNLDPFSVAAALGDTDRLAQTILDWKGCILESDFAFRQMEATAEARGAVNVLYARRTAQQYAMSLDDMSPAVRKRLDQERSELRAKLVRSPLSPQQKRAELEDQEDPHEKVRRLSAELAAAGVTDPRISATVESVARSLGPQQALVEYLRYYRYLGNARWERDYGAMVFSHGGKPRWVSLGRATTLDAQIDLLLRKVSDAETHDGSGLRTALRDTCQSIWQPVASLLPPEVNAVLVSPDGTLSFLPFAALLDAREKFLADHYFFSFVTSGRDLLRPLAARNSGPFAFFGNPDYEHAGIAGGKMPASPGTRRAGGLPVLGPLPRTEEECTKIKALLAGRTPAPILKLGPSASEEALRGLHAPQVVHLATHGAYLSIEEARRLTPLFGDDPAKRSVVYLAGAQRTLDRRLRAGPAGPDKGQLMKTISKSLPPELRSEFVKRTVESAADGGENTANDGIVTAEEISGMRFTGTWLVTLSACETGLGQARAGEGVIGLRRSFIEAGAQNLLMSLWSVNDAATADLMVAFYRRALDTNDAARAWAEVQREWLDHRAADDDSSGDKRDAALFYAVNHAGAFILNRQGPPDDRH